MRVIDLWVGLRSAASLWFVLHGKCLLMTSVTQTRPATTPDYQEKVIETTRICPKWGQTTGEKERRKREERGIGGKKDRKKRGEERDGTSWGEREERRNEERKIRKREEGREIE